MPRPIWKGSITFGLVNIPVALVPATEEKALHFRQLDRKDLTPIHYKRVNEKTGREVPWDDIVKGYEHEKGDFVVLTDADFARANVEATQTVDILDFVDRAEVEPLHYEEPYFLEPLKNGRKAYLLLREALKKSGKAGIAKLVLRTKQHLAMVVPEGPVLLVEMLRYADEIRDPKDLDLPGTLAKEGVTEKELALAEKLVDGMSGAWQPEKYRDDYRDDLMALIEKKIEAGEAKTIDDSAPHAAKPRAGKVVDLMALLEKSLEAKGAPRPAARAAAADARRAPARPHRARRPPHRAESARKSA